MGESKAGSVLERTTLVDADVHLSIPLRELAEYCEEPYRSITANPTYTAVNRSGWDRYMGGRIESEKHNVRSADRLYKKLCVEFHVDYPIINTFSVLTSVPEDDRAVALMRAYNDYLIERYLDEYDNFRGLLSVATQDPNAAAEEIDRLGTEENIVGIYILNSGAIPPLGDSRYDIVYKAAEDNGLHVAFHASAGAPFAKDFPIQDTHLNRFLSVHVLAHPWAQMLTLTSLLTNGTFEKFPDINFSFLESGFTWAPYMMFRFNKEYSMRRSEAPLLERSPEEYIRESCFFTSQPVGEPNDPADLEAIRTVLGSDRIMFSSDYPHWDFDHPDALAEHVRRFGSDKDFEQLCLGTATEAFGLDI